MSNHPDPDQVAFDLITELKEGGKPNGQLHLAGRWREVIEALYAAHALGGTEAVLAAYKTLVKQQRDLIALMSSMEPRPAEAVTPVDFSTCTPLPESTQLGTLASHGASRWLDEYIAFSRIWSPRAYDGFHETVGIWVLSTVAARRVVLPHGGRRYTPLFLALAARTSLYSKSTTADIGISVLRAAGLDWLLAPDETTPQKFVQSLAGVLPADYSRLDEESQERARMHLALSGQRGWFCEEFGQHLSAMAREQGHMAEFKGILRRLDDCKDTYVRETIARGSETIQSPYVALLAGLTPADLKPYAKRGGSMWHDGFWARFAFVTPAATEMPRVDRFPKGDRIIPSSLIIPLRCWHERLGMPELTVSMDETGKSSWKRGPLPERCSSWTDEVIEAYYAYDAALRSLLQRTECKHGDFDGNYARFPEKALRIVMLLASLENTGQIELRHWARAQEITERWRAGLHHVYDQLNQFDQSEAEQLEEKILSIVQRFKEVTPSVVGQYIRGIDTATAREKLQDLVRAGVLEEIPNKKAPKYRLPVQEDVH